MTDKDIANHTLEILRRLDQGQNTLLERIDELKSSMDLQFHAIRDQLSGQLLSEIDIREQMRQYEERLRRIERRLELTETPE